MRAHGSTGATRVLHTLCRHLAVWGYMTQRNHLHHTVNWWWVLCSCHVIQPSESTFEITTAISALWSSKETQQNALQMKPLPLTNPVFCSCPDIPELCRLCVPTVSDYLRQVKSENRTKTQQNIPPELWSCIRLWEWNKWKTSVPQTDLFIYYWAALFTLK